MQILNIGPLELIFVILIALIVLGPTEAISTARKLGSLVSRVVKSPYWSTIMNTSREIKDIPKKIVREGGLDDSMREIRQSTAQISRDISEAGNEIRQAGNILETDENNIDFRIDTTPSLHETEFKSQESDTEQDLG
jgi:Sec-independent protein translocase protein TatA